MNQIQDAQDIISMVTKYCPICGKDITPNNIDRVRRGEDDGFIYVHDDIPHSDDDVDALERGIQ